MKALGLIAPGLVLASTVVAANDIPTLTSQYVTVAPKIDGIADGTWLLTRGLTDKTEGARPPGAGNKSVTAVMLTSVYTKDSVYFLVTWAEPTLSLDRQRWAFDGAKWSKKDQTPLEKGSANDFYEDQLAIMWSINAPTFESEGPWLCTRRLRRRLSPVIGVR